jgi:dihydroneopterin aldolase
MDTITIQDLEVFFRVGVSDRERAEPQRLLISIEAAHDLSFAVEKDDLRWTIDYAAVCQRVTRLAERRSWHLIETLAVEIADLMQREFGAASATVEVKKFVMPQTRFVGVRVTRPSAG